MQKAAVSEEAGFVDRVQFEEGSKRVFCKSGEVEASVARVSVEVSRSSESKSCLCLGLKSKSRAKKSCGC